MTTGPHDHTTSAPGDRFTLIPRPVDHPDATHLLEAFYREQLDRYGFADTITLHPADYTPPHGLFVIAYQRETSVGCGGYRLLSTPPRTVEVKKTYLTPAARGRGIGRAILAWLEHHATVHGAQQAILETGIRNTAAIRLFTGAGYQPIDSYVPGRDPTINRAFAKPLRPPDAPGFGDTIT